ncbi:MAG: tRNA (cytidine(34)-2'-O)-methyltransferase [Rhizobiales bacterium]|nr:tRNA (cytidine(34)-2'-O)-methyltransferase [Hyphomicrobiales bacterium]NRB14095.1 tRNA (cytidine(34)-2'-O)-methyltransferase [Hyphomicrobiales bacterium]
MHLALYMPDIPQNTGTIMRMAACMNLTVHIIEPTGFRMDAKGLKRSGMDYLAKTVMQRHVDWQHFNNWRLDQGKRLILLTTKASTPYCQLKYSPDDVFLFGRESVGVPQDVHDTADERVIVPMKAGTRSLNLAMTTAFIMGEYLRQMDAFPTNTNAAI